MGRLVLELITARLEGLQVTAQQEGGVNHGQVAPSRLFEYQ
jgi:hypothetical protein